MRPMQKAPDQKFVSRDASHVDSAAFDVKTRQNRRDYAKALRSRDIAALKATSMYQQVLAAMVAKEALDVPKPTPAVKPRKSTSQRQAKRQGFCCSPLKEDTVPSKSANTMTPIMLVAELEPSPDSFRANVPNSISPSLKLRKIKSSNTNGSTFGTHTPPRSVTPSLASSDEEDVHDPYRRTSTIGLSYKRKRHNRPQQKAGKISTPE